MLKKIKMSLKYFIFILIFNFLFTSVIYAEFYTFEDSGWSSCRGESWMLDNSEGYSNNNSIKSGKIIGVGESSICRNVLGPATIDFCWKCKNGRLLFLVDGKIKYECNSEDWSPRSYLIREDKFHTIEWRFWKIDVSVEDGAGWIDDVCIKKSMLEPETQIVAGNEIQIVVGNEKQCSNKYSNKTTYVDKSNSNDQKYIYDTITEAIRHVDSGGTVKVAPGEYPEEISIYKPLYLLSMNIENTYLGNDNGESIISIYSNDVAIDGFIMSGADSGIYIINGTNCTLSRNKIQRCGIGINVLYGSNCKIFDNNILDCTTGASINGLNCEIYGNTISKSVYGLRSITYNSKIVDNHLSSCILGVTIKDSLDTRITSCDFTDIRTGGIHLDNSSNCTLNENLIEMELNDNFGIYFNNSNNNIISRNIIRNSNDGITFGPFCSGNIIEPNNIIENIQMCDIFFQDRNAYHLSSVKDRFK